MLKYLAVFALQHSLDPCENVNSGIVTADINYINRTEPAICFSVKEHAIVLSMSHNMLCTLQNIVAHQLAQTYTDERKT